MNKDPKERFSAVAGDYAKYRPTYPDEAIDWLVSRAGLARGARLLDLGCGTGISARLFARRGFDVTGLDPNEEMLARARAAGGGPRYIRAEAARTGLPDASADFAFGAQAFHWFDLPATQRELRRVLRPGARAAALWNVRASTPMLDAYEALLRRRSAEYAQLPRPAGTIERIKALPGISRVEERAFRNPQTADRESFFGRAHSSSYVEHGVADKAAFDRELAALWDEYSRAGRLDLEYTTVVLSFIP